MKNIGLFVATLICPFVGSTQSYAADWSAAQEQLWNAVNTNDWAQASLSLMESIEISGNLSDVSDIDSTPVANILFYTSDIRRTHLLAYYKALNEGRESDVKGYETLVALALKAKTPVLAEHIGKIIKSTASHQNGAFHTLTPESRLRANKLRATVYAYALEKDAELAKRLSGGDGQSIMAATVSNGDAVALKSLLEAGADPNQRELNTDARYKNSATPLFYIYDLDWRASDLRERINNHRDSDESQGILRQKEQTYLQKIKEVTALLKNHGADMNATDKSGFSVLSLVTHPETIKILVENGTKMDVSANNFVYYQNGLPNVPFTIFRSDDPDYSTFFGGTKVGIKNTDFTPAIVHMINGEIEAVRTLVDLGYDACKPNPKTGQNPIDLAASLVKSEGPTSTEVLQEIYTLLLSGCAQKP